LDRLVVDAIT